MAKIILLDPLGIGKGLFKRHRHFLRDWTGGWMLGFFSFPPLDLMYAAAYLRKHGCDASIIEASTKHIYPKDVVAHLKNYRPDFVLLPTTYFTLEEDKCLSMLIKKNIPNTKIIFAGSLVTYDPSLVLSDNTADFVALGELELSMLNIIKGDYSENIAYRKDDRVVSGKRSLIDLKELPIPARDLIDNQAYRYAIFNKRNPVTAMTISRGCPHSKCEFCHSNLYTLGQIRYRTLDSIADEIEEIAYKYKIGEIFFRDQTFTANKELVISLCEYIITHNIDILWRAQTRVDSVDQEILSLMRRAGCYQIAFGFESCSQKSLDMNNKGITIEQSRYAARLAKEAGLEVVGLFIYGMPGDTETSIRKISDFALGLGVDYANFKKFFIVPGSLSYDNHSKRLLNYHKLTGLYTLWGYIRFYLRPKFFLKKLTEIRTLYEFQFLIKSGLDELFFHLSSVITIKKWLAG